VPSTADSPTDAILRHLADIGAGRCAITEEAIVAERDPEMSQVLLGLLVLHEDLAYARRLRDEAEAQRAVVAAERERLLEELRLAVAARDQFLAVASHELRTPLSTMSLLVDNFVATLAGRGEGPGHGGSGDAEPALATAPAPAPIVRQLPVLQRQLARLTTLVLEMLDVSRITGGGLDLVPASVDLAVIVREVVDRFALEARRRQVTVEVSAPAPVVGTWDGARLDQVVTNLMSNALKYGEGHPIEIAVRGEDGRAVLVVRDHGVGIPPQEQTKIFAPFARAVAASHHAGLGLGLWITHQIVRASGGTITADSRPGAGSTFTVELPR
jgi:signal transduction histidine kinase